MLWLAAHARQLGKDAHVSFQPFPISRCVTWRKSSTRRPSKWPIPSNELVVTTRWVARSLMSRVHHAKLKWKEQLSTSQPVVVPQAVSDALASRRGLEAS